MTWHRHSSSECNDWLFLCLGGSSVQIFVALSIFSGFPLFQKRKFAALIVDPPPFSFLCKIVEIVDFDMLYILARSVTRTPLSYVCTISFYFLIVSAFVTFSFFLSFFSSFLGAILIAISEINYIKHCTDRNYVHKHAHLGSDWSLRGSDWSLRTHLGSLFTTARFGLDRHVGRNSRLWS